jgi:hypothetical protein
MTMLLQVLVSKPESGVDGFDRVSSLTSLHDQSLKQIGCEHGAP